MTPIDPHFVAIGASGSEGLGDILELLGSWQLPLKAIVLIAFHRPIDQLSKLRSVLASGCTMSVAVATEAQPLLSGHCYVGEPDGHLAVRHKRLAHLVPAVPGGIGSNSSDRSIDILFTSLAEQAGSKAIGVVMSGSLDDGSRGLAAIHAAGGITMVLDPGAKPRGMQQNAIDYDGPISFIGRAVEIAATIRQVVEGLTTPPATARKARAHS